VVVYPDFFKIYSHFSKASGQADKFTQGNAKNLKVTIHQKAAPPSQKIYRSASYRFLSEP
jgi:hypothetical protein